MAGLGRGGRGQALLDALNQPVRKPGAVGSGGAEKTPQATPQAEVLVQHTSTQELVSTVN